MGDGLTVGVGVGLKVMVTLAAGVGAAVTVGTGVAVPKYGPGMIGTGGIGPAGGKTQQQQPLMASAVKLINMSNSSFIPLASYLLLYKELYSGHAYIMLGQLKDKRKSV